LKLDLDSRAQALLHSILLTLNLGDAKEAPLDGVEVTIVLFGISSIISTFAAGFAMMWSVYLNRQHKRGALMNQQFYFFFKCPMVMLLIALAFLICGLVQQMWYINSSVAYTLAPLAVPGVGMYLWMAVTVLSL